MNSNQITALVQILLSMLSSTALKNLVDALLDMIEDAVKNSESDVDDAIVTPLIQTIRATFEIPDNDKNLVAETDMAMEENEKKETETKTA